MVNGLVEASNENEAAEILLDKELSLVALKKKSSINLNNLSIFNSVGAKDVVIFSRQFSVLISANVALVHSLKLLVDQTKNPRLQQVVADVAQDVDAGTRLSDAFAKFPKVFTSFYVNVVKSGETSGKLDDVLNYLADELEKDYDMNSKIRGAMIYPAVVIIVLAVIGAAMMIFVVPKLTDVISSSGG
mgnify:CR=1 FL=1